MAIFDWIAEGIVIVSMIYISFALTVADWLVALRKGQAVSLLPERGGRKYPLWMQIALMVVGLLICIPLFYYGWIDVYLPLHAGPCQPLPVAAAPESTAGGGTVLLVGDEPPLLSLAKRILEQHGYSVLATASAQIALALAARDDTRIDLLVTDLVMPELSGKELAARILALRPDLKVLYLSGYFHEFAAHPGARAAHETFLAKPFTADELAAKVREALGR